MAARSYRSFLPTGDAPLLGWSSNFNAMINADPTIYGLNTGLATKYAALQNDYALAFQTAIDPSTRTRPTIAAKDTAKRALQVESRLLAKIVEGTASVTDAQKLALGLNVRKNPSPVPAPESAPVVEIMSVNGRKLQIRLHGDEPSRRGRPVDVAGASLFTFVGENPSDNRSDWQFEMSTSKVVNEIEMPTSVTPGSRVWVSAFWYNAKAETGPMSQPIPTWVGYGLTRAA